MSLINQMLRDLENRNPQEKASLKGLEAPVRCGFPAGRAVLPGLLVLVALAGAWGGYHWGNRGRIAPSAATAPVPSSPIAHRDVAVSDVQKQKKEAPRPVVGQGQAGSSPQTTENAVGMPSPEKKTSQTETREIGETTPALETPGPVQRQSAKAVPPTVKHRGVDPDSTALVGTVAPPHAVAAPPPKSSLQPVRKVEAVLTPAQQLEQARHLLQEGRTREAGIRLEGLLRLDPAYDPARDLWVSVLFREGRSVEAERVLRQGMQDGAHPVSYRVQLARWQFEQGQVTEAGTTLAMAQPPAVDRFPGWYALGARIAQQQGRYQEAGRKYEALLRVQAQGRWWLGLALARESAGDFDGARKAYGRLVQNGNATEPMRQFARQRLTALAGSGAGN